MSRRKHRMEIAEEREERRMPGVEIGGAGHWMSGRGK